MPLIIYLIIGLSFTFFCIAYGEKLKKREKIQKGAAEYKRQMEYQEERRIENEKLRAREQDIDIVIEKSTSGAYRVLKKDGNGNKWYLCYHLNYVRDEYDNASQRIVKNKYTRDFSKTEIPRDIEHFSFFSYVDHSNCFVYDENQLPIIKQVIQHYLKYNVLENVFEPVEVLPVSRYIPPKPVLNELGFVDPKPNTLEELTSLLIQAENDNDEQKVNLIHDRMVKLKLLPQVIEV